MEWNSDISYDDPTKRGFVIWRLRDKKKNNTMGFDLQNVFIFIH